jgi:hypothetical protein
MAVTQGCVFVLYWAIGDWWHYFAFWLAPMFVLSRFLSGLRMYGEHAGLALASNGPQSGPDLCGAHHRRERPPGGASSG